MNNTEHLLADRWSEAMSFEEELKKAVIGQDPALRLVTIAVFARGHALLEGGVGVGKTTLLRAVARAMGGEYERIEGTIDLMPSDLVYYTYLDQRGRPGVAPGPLLRKGERLSTFFFNEINRARPQVHSLLLRVMAEGKVTAFNREFAFPYLQVFADRNRVEKEETFELPAAARDRFMLEISVPVPVDPETRDSLVFEPRFHDPERLIAAVRPGVLPFQALNDIAAALQEGITASPALRRYVGELWRASAEPAAFGIRLPDVDTGELIEAGPSPRGMSHLMRAARVQAWLQRRDHVRPEDVQAVFRPAMGHRIFLKPVYEYRRAELIPELVDRILRSVAAP
ncbi:AAA family ATPase [Candidatus Methylocalor cossyra]|uniref:Protein MoxR n=1 Tax=Candidatus Methylocalor cossyra TaxID=3108543 RepID=A0ABM9NDY7_9GAMM